MTRLRHRRLVMALSVAGTSRVLHTRPKRLAVTRLWPYAPSDQLPAPNARHRRWQLSCPYWLPFVDSIRCTLLLALAVAAARPSKPAVAFTRLRRIKRAVCG